MESTQENITQCIYKYSDDAELISKLNDIAEKSGDQTYSTIIHVLTHLNLKPRQAKQCWQEIIAHCQEMSSTMGRTVNLRTAICDYFCSVHKSFKNPIVIEIHIFEQTLKSSKYDSLTGLLNRGALDEALRREMSRAKRHNTDLSVLFFDLDDFKKINDTFGHPAGDKVLKKIAGIIKNEIRQEDIATRYGGEELVIVLPETGKVNALVLGEKIREKVEAMALRFDGHKTGITISGGLAAFPIDAGTATELLKHADSALYRAKSRGKNNISFYSRDKRRFLRINFFSEITIRELGFQDPKALMVKSKDISTGGILFESDHPVDIGTKVQLNLIFNNTDTPLLIIGKVVRVEATETGRYDIGISFLEMDKTTENKIARYMIKQVERSPSPTAE